MSSVFKKLMELKVVKILEYLEELLKKDNVSTFVSKYRDKVYAEFYKNPPTLKNMISWARGIIIPSGDLIIVYQEKTSLMPVIHADIVKWMNENYKGFKSAYYSHPDNMMIEYIDDFLGVERYNDSPDTFIISESYNEIDFDEEDMFDKLINYKRAFERKNKYILDIME